jgi:hypothetical protein
MGLNLPAVALTFAHVRFDFNNWGNNATFVQDPPVKPAVTQIKKNVSGKGENPKRSFLERPPPIRLPM